MLCLVKVTGLGIIALEMDFMGRSRCELTGVLGGACAPLRDPDWSMEIYK